MSGRNSPLPFVAVVASGVLGAWLTGMFETREPAGDVSGADVLLSLFGFFLFLGSLVCLMFLIRRALPPISRAEMAAWGAVREQGKSRFIRNGVARGFSTGLLSVAGIVLYDHLRGEAVIRGLGLYAILLLIIVFAAWYGSSRIWGRNEAAYQTLVGAETPADRREESDPKAARPS